MPIDQVRQPDGTVTIKTGDPIDVMVDRNGQQPEGYVLLSHSKASRLRIWDNLERAMREWARTDRVAAANIRAADRRLVHTVAKAYADYGFGLDDAKLRAELTFAAGIGLLHLAGSAEQAQSVAQRERFLDLMLADPADGSQR